MSRWTADDGRAVDYREIEVLAARISLVEDKLIWMGINNSCVRAAHCLCLQGACVGEW